MSEIILTYTETMELRLLLEAITAEGSTVFFEAMGLPPKIVKQPQLLFTEARILVEDYYKHSYDFSYLPTKYSRFSDKNVPIFFKAVAELYDQKTSQTFYHWASYNIIQTGLRRELDIWYRFFLEAIRSLLNSKPVLLEAIADRTFLVEVLSPLHPDNILPLFAEIQKCIQQTNSEWEQWLVSLKQRGVGDFDIFTAFDFVENARSLISNTITSNRVYEVFNKLEGTINMEQLEQMVRTEYPDFTEPFLVPTIDTKKFIN